jgi:putative tryptophan/tyrosine transport system substrate-binding protein
MATPAHDLSVPFLHGGWGLNVIWSGCARPIQACGFILDRILRGAKVAELPVQQPIKYELTINIRTAKALGVIIPPGVLAIADEAIE